MKLSMATIKSYTDIPQSKTLRKILPLESADMKEEWLINLVKGHIEWLEDRIREQLSNGQVYGGELVKAKNSLSWLEKQGEISDKIVERARTEKQRILVTESDGVANIDWDTRSLQDVKLLLEHGLDYIKKLEKQGEQKLINKVEPKFKIKYAGREYNVLEVKDIAGVTFYGIEDEPNNIDYVKAENCERVCGYNIKEKGSPYPTKPAVFSEQNPAWSEEDKVMVEDIIEAIDTQYAVTDYNEMVNWLKSLKDRYTWKPSDEQNIYKNGVYQETNGVRIWHNGHTFLVPKDWNKGKWPLLNKKGEKNSKQNKEYLMNEIDALLDWDFVAATKHIQDLGTDIPLKDGEYLITAPVWLAMYEHRIALNKALSNIGAMEIDFNEDFWFAERYNVYNAWGFNGTNRNLNGNYVSSANQVGAVSL